MRSLPGIIRHANGSYIASNLTIFEEPFNFNKSLIYHQIRSDFYGMGYSGKLPDFGDFIM